MPVAIITDSAASLPAELAAKWDVTVVPMWLVIEGELVRESDVHLDRLLAASDVTTSGPNPAEFNEAIEQQGPDADVVVLTIASTMSSTHQAATLAARAAGDRVRVIDTSTAAGAEGLIVLAAAEAAQQGANLDVVEATARRVARRVQLVATVPTLDHLVRSGRVPGIAGWAGRALDISPLFEFGSGKVKKLRPAHGHDAALERISPTLDEAATGMGSPWQSVLKRVHLPLLRGPITVGLLLVFVDTVKELPLTFALRPFDFDTLSVRVFQYAGDERLAEALLPALMILVLGLIAAMALVPTLDHASSRDRSSSPQQPL